MLSLLSWPTPDFPDDKMEQEALKGQESKDSSGMVLLYQAEDAESKSPKIPNLKATLALVIS